MCAVPADKAANNVVFVRRLYYINTLIIQNNQKII